MANKDTLNLEEPRMQKMLGNYLQNRAAEKMQETGSMHLDEDLLTAFVEGKTGERESPAVIRHLVDCTFCLHVTAELVRLNTAFGDEPIPVLTGSSEPASVSSVLQGLLSKIFGTADGAVFAHQQDEEPEEQKKDEEEKTD